MGDINRSKRYVVQDYSTYSKTKVQLDGENIYFHSVITGQIKDVHIMGDGSSQINQLPFIESLEIYTASNVDLETLRIAGNRVKIFNSGSAAITVQTGTTGTPTYENINEKCSSVAFFDGTYWRVEDGAQIGDLKPWHKNFQAGALSLPWGWVAMDGTVIDDAESPFDTETLEDMNGDKRFVRGGATSGTPQDDAMQRVTGFFAVKHAVIESSGGAITASGSSSTLGIGTSVTNNRVAGFDNSESTSPNPAKTDDVETRPINITMVWIMKIK